MDTREIGPLPFEEGFKPFPTNDAPPIKRKPGRPRKNPLPDDVQSLTQEPGKTAKAPSKAMKQLSVAAAYDMLYPAVSMLNGAFKEMSNVGKIPGIALSDAEIKKECQLLAEVPPLRIILARADNAYLKLIAYNSVLVWQRAKMLREYKAMFDSMTPEDRQQFMDMAEAATANTNGMG